VLKKKVNISQGFHYKKQEFISIMNKKKLSTGIIGLISFFILVILDQITKKLAVLHLKGQNPVVLVKNVFQLYYLENRGAAFGILQGQRSVFILITVIILAFIVYCYIKAPYERKFWRLRGVLILIAAGAIGNFIDRTIQGYVVDFFYFNLIDFPIFNVADIYVTCAAVCLVLLVLFGYKDEDWNELMQSLGLKKKDDK
jgi:signal peptidase II